MFLYSTLREIGASSPQPASESEVRGCEMRMVSTGQPASIWPTIGVVTALPKEHAAMKTLLDNPRPLTVGDRQYVLGDVPSDLGGMHQIVLVLAAEGENSAAIAGSVLLNYLPSITDLIMVGIAGGIPAPAKPDHHVRLGDIVVSGEGGVVQYDYLTDTGKASASSIGGATAPRHPPRPPSARLLNAVRLLEAEEYSGTRPRLDYISRVLKELRIKRPGARTDLLADTYDAGRTVPHPNDPRRRRFQPRVFRGTIASANRLLKNPVLRDQLRDRFGVKAVEMEASGIADASWTAGVGYLVVRGVCDYCDRAKGDGWQLYAAAAAAGYTRSLLASMPVLSDPRLPEREDGTAAKDPDGRPYVSRTRDGLETPPLLLRDFSYYSTDPYHPPMEGPYYPEDLMLAPSAAASFTIASTSRTPIRLQNIYLSVREFEPLQRATFPVYERGNGATPILSWVELGGIASPCRIMAERRSKVGSRLDPSDFHVRVFSRHGGRYRVGVEVDWINMDQQDQSGSYAFPETFPLDIAELVTWESLVKGAKRIRALFDSSAPFLAEALGAMAPGPAYTILAHLSSAEEGGWVRRQPHCYPVPSGEDQALTALTGVHQVPYEQGPLQFILIDGHTLVLQEDEHIGQGRIIQDQTRVEAISKAFDELAQRLVAA